MLDLSKHFKNDIITPNQTLIPVVIITDTDGTILHSLSTHTLKLNPNINTKPILSKVSKVRISTDYDKKSLKINTLRCDIYNYYDVKDRFTDVYDLTAKMLYLYYKSPTTNTIAIDEEPTDYDCALIYIGEINRIEHNSDTISIIAEDSTQLKISDKNVPYMTQDKLTQEIRENVLEEYKDDAITVPMVFGSVDKAPVLPYLDSENARTMDVLFDRHPTAGHFKTGKIPSVIKTSLPIANDFYLYIKRDKDYIIWNHEGNIYNYQGLYFSKSRIINTYGSTINYLLPELQEELEGFGLWSINGLYQRQVESVSAGVGSIIDVANIEVEDSSNHEFSNISQVNNNAGYEKTWYREGDSITNYLNDYSVNFDTGLNNWNSTDNISGEGRWILLKLDKGISDTLRNVQTDGIWIGNTWLAADWSLGRESSAQELALLGITNTGFHVTPISTAVWKERIPEILERITSDGDQDYEDLINNILLETDEDLQNSNTEDFYYQYAPSLNQYENSAIQLSTAGGTVSTNSDSRYWGMSSLLDNPYNQGWTKIQGLYYGDKGSSERVLLENANVHDYIAIFEFFPQNWYNNNRSYEQQLLMNNVGFLQSVHVENLREEEIFASIVGRKSNYYTEQILTDLNFETYEIPSFEQIINGIDENHPHFPDIANGHATIIQNAYNNYLFTSIYSAGEGNLGEGYLEILFPEILQEEWNNMIDLDDSPVHRNFNLFKSSVMVVISKIIRMYASMYWSSWGWHHSNTAHNVLLNTNLSVFLNENMIRSVSKRMLEYIYFTDLDEVEHNWTFTFLNANWYSAIGGWDSADITEDSIDLTNEINTAFNYQWHDFTTSSNPANVTTQEWIDNFGIYIDDTVFQINKNLYEHTSSLICVPYFNIPNYPDVTAYLISIDTYLGSESWVNEHLTISNLPSWETFIFSLEEELHFLWNELISDSGSSLMTNGIIERPSDIVINILTCELGYGKRDTNDLLPNYDKFDLDSIEKSRSAHYNFKMGFAINEQTDAKKLIENVLAESKSYPKFNSNGKFGLITIKEKYTLEDTDKAINVKEIISYKISKTKREDVMTSCKMFYRYDNGIKKYNLTQSSLSVEELLYEYDGHNFYNLEEEDGHKDIKLRYHTDTNTVIDFQKYRLLNECNVHNLISLKLPLSYIDISVGDVIHIPLINNELAYGIDYSKVSYLNGQAIYPLWLVMETNIGIDDISIKAYQLHYLGTDGDHGYGENYDIIGNMNEFNSLSNSIIGNPLPNWNYSAVANVHNNIEIPYGDVEGDGIINVIDIINVVSHVLGNTTLSPVQLERIKNIDLNTGEIIPTTQNVDVTHIVGLVNWVTAQ